MRVRRASTSWVTSFTILALVFGLRVVNHLARRTLPCREMRRIQLTCEGGEGKHVISQPVNHREQRRYV